MAPNPLEILVVGGGQAGGRAALAARAANPTARITVLAGEAHYPYERPILSKAALLDITARPPFVLDDATAASADIIVLLSTRATFIDRAQKRVRCANGAEHRYDKLILATGSQLRQVQIAGVSPERIHYVRTIEDSKRLHGQLNPQTAVAVVGGGFIGLEVAATARARGCKVTVIEAAPVLLSRVGVSELSDFVAHRHRANGVDIRLDVKCIEAEGERLRLSDRTYVEAQVIVAGVGVAPCTALAEAAGLTVDDGIVTDACGRTSDSDIFAAGDVTQQFNPACGRQLRLESWENANLQGAAVGRSAAGVPTEASSIPWFWSDQGDLNIQIVGRPSGQYRTITRGSADGMTVFQLSNNKLVGAITLDRARDMPLIRRVVGGDGVFDPAALADESQPLRQVLKPA